MTQDEALDLALKTLRSVAGELYRVTSNCDTYDALAETNNAIMDIQQARSAPVQKRPQNCGTGYCSCVECVMKPAPVQEPVAVPKIEWVNTSSDWVVRYLQAKSIFNAEQIGEMMDFAALAANKFYTTPPAAQRQWVGLTYEEAEELRIEKEFDKWGITESAFKYAVRDIEAKLRSKNI